MEIKAERSGHLRVSPPLPGSAISTALCGRGLSPGESGSDGGDLCAVRLAHYVGNEVQQPGGGICSAWTTPQLPSVCLFIEMK